MGKRPIRLTVEKYLSPPDDYHICRDEAGNTHRVDLLVGGSFPKSTTPQSLVGRLVSCQDLFPHMELAGGVRVVGQAEKGSDG